jgi:hypothetical protein
MTAPDQFRAGVPAPARNPEIDWVEETRMEIEAQRRARGLPVHPRRNPDQGGTTP